MSTKWQSWIILILLSIIWGGSFILMKRGLEVFSFSQVASLRLLISGIVLLPFALMNLKKISLAQYKVIIIFGVLNAGIPPFLFAKAQTVIPSSTAGILNALTPLFTLVIGSIFFRVSLGINKIAGVLLGLLGAFLIILFRADSNNFEMYSGYALLMGFLIVIADFCYGTSSNINKSYLHSVPAMQIASFLYTTMAIPAGIYLFAATDFTGKMAQGTPAWEAVAYIFILAAFGSALAMYLFSRMIKNTSALFASFVTYLIPFVALIFGYFDGEKIGFIQIAGLLVILSGIYIANKRFSKKQVSLVAD